jgi:hypothetical protein
MTDDRKDTRYVKQDFDILGEILSGARFAQAVSHFYDTLRIIKNTARLLSSSPCQAPPRMNLQPNWTHADLPSLCHRHSWAKKRKVSKPQTYLHAAKRQMFDLKVHSLSSRFTLLFPKLFFISIFSTPLSLGLGLCSSCSSLQLCSSFVF